VWGANVQGRALGLAVADGRLFVSTDTGAIVCFGRAGELGPSRGTVVDGLAETVSEDTPDRPEIRSILQRINSTPAARQGYGLLLGSEDLQLTKSIARESDLQLQLVVRDTQLAAVMRQELLACGLYGSRVTVVHLTNDVLPYTDGFANVVIDEAALAGRPSSWSSPERFRVLRPYGSLIWSTHWDQPGVSPPLDGAADWTHLYANTANTAATDDRYLAANMQLQWFGGPGPRGMVDRHLRGPSPLVASGRVYIPAENGLIGVDSFNGTELWRLSLPGSQRYSIPYDSGYMAADGNHVFIAVRDALWTVDGRTGEVTERRPLPSIHPQGQRHWGYVGAVDGAVFGSVQKPAAARQEPSRHAIDEAYWSRQPLVTSEVIFRLGPDKVRPVWSYTGGAMINTTITIFSNRLFFLESRHPSLQEHPTGRIPLKELTAAGLHLVALDSVSGVKRWERRLDLRHCENIVYLSAAQGLLALVGSGVTPNEDSRYVVRVFDTSTGEEHWSAAHDHGKPGALGHGEQVHHPVILGDLLVTEPVIYELQTGRPYSPDGDEGRWQITRPGHSCGTMSGAGSCLFFRADNPTVVDVRSTGPNGQAYHKLAPTRPGCWINMIPANGLLLIPEASAGCVCAYPIQTSMAFRVAGSSEPE